MNYPFSLFKRTNSEIFYVRFKNSITNLYDSAISTGTKDKSEAIKIAWNWYTNGIPTKTKSKKETFTFFKQKSP